MDLKMLKEKKAELASKLEDEMRSAAFNTEEVEQLITECEKLEQEIRSFESIETIKQEKEEIKMEKHTNVMEEVRAMLTTGEGSKVIPTTIAEAVIAKLEEKYSFFAEIPVISGVGKIEVLKELNPKSAEFYAELGEIALADEEFEKVELGLKRVGSAIQLTKNFVYNAQLDESYFVDKLAERIARKIAVNLVLGTGDETNFDGLVNLKNEVVTKAQGALSLDDIIKAVASLHPSVLANAKVMVARSTFQEMAQWKDGNGNLLMVREKNAQNEFVYKIVGLEVVINDAVQSVASGNRPVFIVNPALWNKRVEQEIQVEKIADVEGARKGVYTYVADMFADVKVVDEQQAIAIKIK
ncbi:phage major capsid protein [Bacillus sp. AGMB 02131]|uniref:Phage major capsid protein n=1 Tax=Peribacillus faecalis TaxID=2772559 RepID=A0A927HA51_9BACI|nr:phage major capsid protein [Peribacillus faecalis]MBD3107182.1 phage major capsid protein [Peribacillus faecalis]